MEAIAGGSAPRYRVAPGDVGCSLRVVVAMRGPGTYDCPGNLCGCDTAVVLPARCPANPPTGTLDDDDMLASWRRLGMSASQSLSASQSMSNGMGGVKGVGPGGTGMGAGVGVAEGMGVVKKTGGVDYPRAAAEASVGYQMAHTPKQIEFLSVALGRAVQVDSIKTRVDSAFGFSA